MHSKTPELNQIETIICTFLSDGTWKSPIELRTHIPEDLALACSKLASPLSYDGCGPVAYGQVKLTAEALKSLEAKDLLETRKLQAGEQVRLIGVGVPTLMAPTSPNNSNVPAAAAPPVPIAETPAVPETPDQPHQEAAQPEGHVGTDKGPTENDGAGTDDEPVSEPPSVSAPARQVVMLPVKDLQLHPDANHVPRMRDEEWQSTRQDILARGVDEPVCVQQPNLILDGRHRHEAAIERGDTLIPAIIVDLPPDEQVALIYRRALLRRHLSDDQRAVLAARLQKAEAKDALHERAVKGGESGGRGRPKPGGDSLAPDACAKLSPANPEPKQRTSRSDERAAAQHNVSRRKLRAAGELDKANSELADDVLVGQKSLAEAKRQSKRDQAAPAGPTVAAAKPEERAASIFIKLPQGSVKVQARTLIRKLGKSQADKLARTILGMKKAVGLPASRAKKPVGSKRKRRTA